MATKVPTVSTQLASAGDVMARTFTYTPMVNADDGTPIQSGLDWDEMSVQVLGTFGAGGSATVQGSNDGGTTWATLTTDGNTAIAITASGIKRIAERCDRYKPIVTAGDGSTSLTVVIAARRKHPGR